MNGSIMKPSLTSLASRLSTDSGSFVADWGFLDSKDVDGVTESAGWKPSLKPLMRNCMKVESGWFLSAAA